MPGQRDAFNHPHPIYDMPGFGIDALPKSCALPKEVVAAKTGDFTSAAIAHGTNGFEILGTFASGCTSAKLEILDANDSDKVLATYTLTPLAAVKFFTFFDTRVEVAQHPSLKFKVSSIAGGGSASIAISIRPTA